MILAQVFTALVGLHDVRSLGLESTLSIASHADVLKLVTRDKPKDVCFRNTLSKDLLVPLIPTGYRWSAHVHVAAHRMSPKSSFLNAPRGLILYLIDQIMTRSTVMCYKVRRLPHTNPLVPAIIRTCVFYLVLLFPNCPFFPEIYFSLFSILMKK